MGLIKTIRDNDGEDVYRTVPLSVFVTVAVVLCSAIGAQQTWLWAAKVERSELAIEWAKHVETLIREDNNAIEQSIGGNTLRVDALGRRIDALDKRYDDLEKIVLLNDAQIKAALKR